MSILIGVGLLACAAAVVVKARNEKTHELVEEFIDEEPEESTEEIS